MANKKRTENKISPLIFYELVVEIWNYFKSPNS